MIRKHEKSRLGPGGPNSGFADSGGRCGSSLSRRPMCRTNVVRCSDAVRFAVAMQQLSCRLGVDPEERAGAAPHDGCAGGAICHRRGQTSVGCASRARLEPPPCFTMANRFSRPIHDDDHAGSTPLPLAPPRARRGSDAFRPLASAVFLHRHSLTPQQYAASDLRSCAVRFSPGQHRKQQGSEL